MTWVKRAPEPHVCKLPYRSPLRAEGRAGDLWRCDDCHVLWQVHLERYGWLVPYWREAPWWVRLQHRRPS